MSIEGAYAQCRHIPEQGLCGLGSFLFTTGLVCGLDETGYKYRYCYEHLLDAAMALESWDGKGHPSGPWIKRKGRGGEVVNTKHPDYDSQLV